MKMITPERTIPRKLTSLKQSKFRSKFNGSGILGKDEAGTGGSSIGVPAWNEGN